ncbi:hypothetical protein KAU11_05465 [Candidatus Babeliales bacterium]|nr:hypothetical protein [Candidatus Babeliales bacterium]
MKKIKTLFLFASPVFMPVYSLFPAENIDQIAAQTKQYISKIKENETQHAKLAKRIKETKSETELNKLRNQRINLEADFTELQKKCIAIIAEAEEEQQRQMQLECKKHKKPEVSKGNILKLKEAHKKPTKTPSELQKNWTRKAKAILELNRQLDLAQANQEKQTQESSQQNPIQTIPTQKTIEIQILTLPIFSLIAGTVIIPATAVVATYLLARKKQKQTGRSTRQEMLRIVRKNPLTYFATSTSAIACTWLGIHSLVKTRAANINI